MDTGWYIQPSRYRNQRVDVRLESHGKKGSERWKATNSSVSLEIEREEVTGKRVHLRRSSGGKGNATPDEQVDVRHYGLVFPWGVWRVYFGVFCVVSKGKAARRL